MRDTSQEGAGAALDARVATEVMGWRLSERGGGYSHAVFPPRYMWEDRSQHIARSVGDWSPSTRIADAFVAVEHLFVSGFELEIKARGGEIIVRFWMDCDDGDGPLCLAEQDEAYYSHARLAHAISRAALQCCEPWPEAAAPTEGQ